MLEMKYWFHKLKAITRLCVRIELPLNRHQHFLSSDECVGAERFDLLKAPPHSDIPRFQFTAVESLKNLNSLNYF
jgi:hypothetical protein